MMIKYRETLSHRYDGDTTRSWKDRELTPEQASAKLENLSKQRTMLWEALSNLRSLRGDLDEETRRTFVNYICMRVFFPQFDEDPPAKRHLQEHGIEPELVFYDIANLFANDPHSEAWRDWNPSGKYANEDNEDEDNED